MGVQVRGGRGAAVGAGLQGHAAAAQLPGAVGHLAGQRGDPGPGALRPPHQLPQGGPPVPAQLVLLQVGDVCFPRISLGFSPLIGYNGSHPVG